MEFIGWVVIHTGQCKTRKFRFALIPDFMIPRRRISRFGHQRLSEYYRKSAGNIQAAIDECLEGLGDEFYLPRSTVMSCLALQVRGPPAGPQ